MIFYDPYISQIYPKSSIKWIKITVFFRDNWLIELKTACVRGDTAGGFQMEELDRVILNDTLAHSEESNHELGNTHTFLPLKREFTQLTQVRILLISSL